MQALLRRPRAARQLADVYDDGYLLVNFASHDVSVNGAPADLTPTEFRLLAAMIRHPGRDPVGGAVARAGLE